MAATLDEFGREVLDETPIAFPVGFERPEPLHLRIRRLVEHYHQEMKEKEEYESFEDADDFDIEDGVPSWEDNPSDYEVDFMPHFPVDPEASKPEQGTPAPATEDPPQAESTIPEPLSK